MHTGSFPIHPDDRPLLGIDGGNVFLDMALPFGLRLAPKIFSAFADALAWITYQHGMAPQIHYLDDFFMVGPPDSPTCEHSYHLFLHYCHVLRVLVAIDKLVPSYTTLTFLGIEIDSVRLQCRLPADIHTYPAAIAYYSRNPSGDTYSVWALAANNPDTHLLWAVCCLAFFGFLQSGELTTPSQDFFHPQYTLLLSDIALDTHNNPTMLAVTLKQSKTDPFRLGVTLFMGRTDDIVCPVKALTSYLAVRPQGHGPLFTFQDGSYVPRAPRVVIHSKGP